MSGISSTPSIRRLCTVASRFQYATGLNCFYRLYYTGWWPNSLRIYGLHVRACSQERLADPYCMPACTWLTHLWLREATHASHATLQDHFSSLATPWSLAICWFKCVANEVHSMQHNYWSGKLYQTLTSMFIRRHHECTILTQFQASRGRLICWTKDLDKMSRTDWLYWSGNIHAKCFQPYSSKLLENQ